MPSTHGQASVELVSLVPLIALALAALAQVVALGHTAWAASQAASAAARAAAVEGDVRAAARGALPRHLERGLRVVAHDGGEVEVRLRAPALIPAIDLGPVTARGRFTERS